MFASSSWFRTPVPATSSRVRVFGIAIVLLKSADLFNCIRPFCLPRCTVRREYCSDGCLGLPFFACCIADERRNLFERRAGFRYQAGTHLPDMQKLGIRPQRALHAALLRLLLQLHSFVE